MGFPERVASACAVDNYCIFDGADRETQTEIGIALTAETAESGHSPAAGPTIKIFLSWPESDTAQRMQLNFASFTERLTALQAKWCATEKVAERTPGSTWPSLIYGVTIPAVLGAAQTANDNAAKAKANGEPSEAFEQKAEELLTEAERKLRAFAADLASTSSKGERTIPFHDPEATLEAKTEKSNSVAVDTSEFLKAMQQYGPAGALMLLLGGIAFEASGGGRGLFTNTAPLSGVLGRTGAAGPI